MNLIKEDYVITKKIPLDINYIFKVFFIPNYLVDDITLTKKFYHFLRARSKQVADTYNIDSEDILSFMVFLIYGKKILVEYKKAFSEDELFFPIPLYKLEKIAQKFNFNVKPFLSSIGITSSKVFLNPSKLLTSRILEMRSMKIFLGQMPFKSILKKMIPLSYANLSHEIDKSEPIEEATGKLTLGKSLFVEKFKELNKEVPVVNALGIVEELMDKYGINQETYEHLFHKVMHQMVMPKMHFPIMFESDLGKDSFLHIWHQDNKEPTKVPEVSLLNVLTNWKISGMKVFQFTTWAVFRLRYEGLFKDIFTPDNPVDSNPPGNAKVIYLTKSGYKIFSDLFNGPLAFMKFNFANKYKGQHLNENKVDSLLSYSKASLLERARDSYATYLMESEESDAQMDLFDKTGSRANLASEFFTSLGYSISPEVFHNKFKELDAVMGEKKVRSFFSGSFYALGAIISKKGFELPCTVARFKDEIEKLPVAYHTKYDPYKMKMILVGDNFLSMKSYDISNPIMKDVYLSDKDEDSSMYEVIDFKTSKVKEALHKFFDFI